jgi:hypothetical protein
MGRLHVHAAAASEDDARDSRTPKPRMMGVELTGSSHGLLPSALAGAEG